MLYLKPRLVPMLISIFLFLRVYKDSNHKYSENSNNNRQGRDENYPQSLMLYLHLGFIHCVGRCSNQKNTPFVQVIDESVKDENHF